MISQETLRRYKELNLNFTRVLYVSRLVRVLSLLNVVKSKTELSLYDKLTVALLVSQDVDLQHVGLVAHEE